MEPIFPNSTQPEVTFRDFFDVDAQREQIFDNVQSAIAKKYAPGSLTNQQYSLELTDLNYRDREKRRSFADQKDAILKKKNIDVPLYGKWRLIDNETGKVIQEKKKLVARVPYLTDRGTFIYRGNEWILQHQQRLKPGVYARKKDNGELESHVNLIPGTGRGFRLFMEPEIGLFKMRVGQANIPAITVLEALGAEKEELEDAWGPDLYKVNKEKARGFNLNRIYSKFADNHTRRLYDDPVMGLRATFEKMRLNPEVASRTLGAPYENVDKAALTRALQKLVNIQKGEEQEDDRDAQANQTVYSPEDLIAERIAKDAGGMSRQLLWKVTNKKNLDNIPSNFFSKQMYTSLLNSGLGMPLQEINPLEIGDQLVRVSRLGEGGISDSSVVPDSARNVQPSQVGFVDFNKAPESTKIGVDSRFASGAMKGSDNNLYARVIDAKTGKEVIKSSVDVGASVVAFPGELAAVSSGKRDRVRAMKDGQIKFVKPEEVDYEVKNGNAMFSFTSNLIPGFSSVKGGRLLMGSRMITQALALQNPEAPLVQAATAEDPEMSYEQQAGPTAGARYAKEGGIVKAITPDGIEISHEDGTTSTVDLYNNFALNNKSYIGNTPVVEVGQEVEEGQLLAHSNFTDKDGTAAVGANFRTAFMPFKGLNYEDAFVVSESAAKRLTSEHMYQVKEPLDDDTVEIDKKAFLVNYPGKYTKDQLKTIGNDGVVKPGTILEKGDPIMLKVGTRKPQKGQAILKQQRSWFVDKSTTWDNDYSGEVTDIATDGDGIKVLIKSYQPLQEGDKISQRYGGKGVVNVVPDAEMPRDPETDLPYEVLANPMGLISRVNSGQIHELLLAKIARKTGKPYKLPTFTDESYIDFVEKELAKHNMKPEVDVYNPNTKSTLKDILAGEMFFMKLHHSSACFDAQTEVLTENGWKLWKDVVEGEKLASVEGANLVFEQPISLFEYDYSGPMYGFSGRKIDYLVTPNHSMYTRGSWKTSKYQFKAARDIHCKEYVMRQGGFNYAPSVTENTYTLDDGTELSMGDYCSLLGWYLSEGSIPKKRAKSAVIIYQSEDANEENVRLIEGLCDRCGFRWTHFKAYGRVMGVRICNPALTRDFAEYGNSYYDKFIPRRVLNRAPVDALRALYDSLMRGDGWIAPESSKGSSCYTTASKQLAADFNELCLKLGKTTTTHFVEREGKPHTIKGQNVNLSNAYECTVRDTYTVEADNRRNNYYVEQYVGKVYCAEMPTGLLLVRRNGKVLLTGNSKASGRDIGSYTFDRTPAKGGGSGSKRVGGLETFGLISHGVPEVMRDAKLVRGQKNDEFWSRFRQGLPIKVPDKPFIYDKFLSYLQGSGINVQRDGDQMSVTAMTDADVDKWAGDRELTSGDAISLKTNEPIKGGLFDLSLTGGFDGSRISKINLPYPVPNPIMEEPIRRLMGYTKAQLTEKLGEPGGSQEIYDKLAAVDVDKMLAQELANVKSGKKSTRDNSVKLLRFLEASKRTGIHPKDFMITKVPVIPPKFRPVTSFNNMEMTSDVNLLYKDLFELNKDMKALEKSGIAEPKDRQNLYNAVKAVTGLGDPVNTKNKEKKVAGLLKHVFGKKSAKTGIFQQKLLSSNVDIVGRGVILPDPNLDMDHVGVPEEMAWKLYRPHIARRLAKKYNAGKHKVPLTQIAKWVADRDPRARQAMLDEMEDRPIIYSRAPAWHKFSVMGAYPRLVKGTNLKMSPIMTKGFGADFDGDENLAQIIIGVEKDSDYGKEIGIDGLCSDYDSCILNNMNNIKLDTAVNVFNEKSHEFFVVDLKDFPRGELSREYVNSEGVNVRLYTVPEGIKVLSVDTVTQKIVLADVYAYSVHDALPPQIVNLKNKQQVITDDDPRGVFALDANTLEYDRYRPSDSLGKFVPLMQKGLSSYSFTEKNLYKPDFLVEAKKEKYSKLDSVQDEFELTYESGYSFGCIIGDGWVSRHIDKESNKRKYDGLCLANNEATVRNKFVAGIEQILYGEIKGDLPSVVQFSDKNKLPGSSGSTKVTIGRHGRYLGELFESTIKCGANFKELPPFALNAPLDFKLGLFAGLIDTDGSFSYSNAKKKPQFMCNYSTNSIHLAMGLKTLLASLDVHASITMSKVTRAGHNHYIVSISTPDLQKFAINNPTFRVYHEGKAEKLEQLKSIDYSTSTAHLRNDIVPIPTQVASDIAKSFKTGDKDYTEFRRATKTNYVTRSRALLGIESYSNYGKDVSDLMGEWINIVQSGINFSEIVSVETAEYPEVGYDITVPGYETFFDSHGVLRSNTMNFHVPTTDEAVREVKQKMMPSKNLLSESDFDVHMLPSQEFLAGLYTASLQKKHKSGDVRVFDTKKDLYGALLRGEIGINDPVKIKED